MRLRPASLLSWLLSGFLLCLNSGMASAERISTVTIAQAQQNLRSQIQYGLAEGLISPDEAQVFYRRERAIQAREVRYRQNPQASPRERDAIWRDIDAMAADVQRKLRGTSSARDHADSLAKRQARLNQRIDTGIAAGLILAPEARQLQQRLSDIGRREARLQASGQLQGIERDRLHRDIDRLEWEFDRLLDHARRDPYRAYPR